MYVREGSAEFYVRFYLCYRLGQVVFCGGVSSTGKGERYVRRGTCMLKKTQKRLTLGVTGVDVQRDTFGVTLATG